MFKFGILILILLFVGCSQAPKEDLTQFLGFYVGKPISEKYLDSTSNEYPTRILKLETSSIEAAKNFDVLTIQIIESDKSIYSITAEKKFNTSDLCDKEFQKLYQLYNAKYAHLKQTKKLKVGNNVINSDDGYKSLDGTKHLQLLGCSVDEKGIHQLELSLWDSELQKKSDMLWSKFTANK
ncbi:hypothetical protein tinsulaeT_00600 [Thalassotalea insulae]|uniref:Uncharacterized protein n=1 Tax=Thalassotalea insulae TaxID=2056778 RepID=A0ABQ6GQK4_9GAMM|nr:hypothetical protein [Thalassotalea insulae]GLX76720.1 hypothetical protein tinsulaeT_00600 [Thalassotalea insulae]